MKLRIVLTAALLGGAILAALVVGSAHAAPPTLPQGVTQVAPVTFTWSPSDSPSDLSIKFHGDATFADRFYAEPEGDHQIVQIRQGDPFTITLPVTTVVEGFNDGGCYTGGSRLESYVVEIKGGSLRVPVKWQTLEDLVRGIQSQQWDDKGGHCCLLFGEFTAYNAVKVACKW